MPLVDSDKWKADFISLRSLRFHPRNPRFPELPNEASEHQIIETLCARGGAIRLAKSIAEKGYLRNERLIVVKENNKHVVYEGNRRLCALKILANPEAAPAKHRKAVKRLSEQARLPKKIAVDIVPSKFDAEVVMYSKHTDDGYTVKWRPVQQAAFIAGQLEEGVSLDDLNQQRGIKRETVLEALALLDLYRIARNSGLSPEATAMIDDPDKFPTSTVFERLFVPKSSRDKLGVEFTTKGMVVKSERASFLAAVAKMMHDAATDKIDTRSLNKAEEQIAYIDSLKVSPSETSFGAADVAANEAEESKPSAAASPASKTGTAKSVKPTQMLFPKDLTIGYDHEKLSRMLDEGKTLKVDQSHAAALLLRAFVEISASVWLRKKKLYNRIKPRNPEFGASFAELLGYLNSEKLALGFDATVKQALDALVAKRVKHSKFELDRIAHFPDAIATKENVLEVRGLTLPLLAILLTEPA